jgi:hypothetical protein
MASTCGIFPVIVLTSPAGSGEDVLRAVPQIAATIILATLSWRFVEEPVRHGALGRLWLAQGGGPLEPPLWKRVRWSGWRTAPGRPVVLGASAGLAGLLVVACAGLAGAFPAPVASSGGPGSATGGALPGSHTVPLAARLPQGPRPPGLGSREPPAAEPRPRTSCHAVVHIGDSTSDGLISPDYLPDAAQRIPAQYHDVGVSRVIPEISGARSIVEILPGQVNGYNVARTLYAGGYRGCWVIALGTNDTANVAVGSSVGLMTRIEQMMSVAHGEPVMWVNVKSLVASGPYSEADMRLWNAALMRACARYPNMAVFNWAAVVRDSWFISDGIHYTSAGYAARGRLIATALALAFPKAGSSAGCLVG